MIRLIFLLSIVLCQFWQNILELYARTVQNAYKTFQYYWHLRLPSENSHFTWPMCCHLVYAGASDTFVIASCAPYSFLLLPHTVNCVTFFFSTVNFFVFHFVCESNISGTAERICAKFTGKTCLVPRSDEFECQGQRSRWPRTKTHCPVPSPPPLAVTESNALTANNVMQQQTGPFRRRRGWFRRPACSLCLAKRL